MLRERWTSDDCQLRMQQALTWNNRNRREVSKGVVSDLLVNLAQEEDLRTAHRGGICLVLCRWNWIRGGGDDAIAPVSKGGYLEGRIKELEF